MKNIKKKIIILIFFSLTIPYLSVQAEDYNLGVSSMPIKIENGLRGVTYHQTITIHNNKNNETQVYLNTTGEIKDWISFSNYNDSFLDYNNLTIPANMRYKIKALIKIPENVSNRRYKSTIIVSEIGTVKNKTGQVSVRFSYPLPVQVIVTGDQILEGSIDSIHLSEIEVEYPVKTKIVFRNTGNVIANPKINIKFYKNDLFVEKIQDINTKVQPNDVHHFELTWNTSGMVPGNYLAKVMITLGEKTLMSKDINFELFKVGSLKRKGILTFLTTRGTAKAGENCTIISRFSNTGQIEVVAKFIGKVYRENKLIDTFESMELVVPKNVEEEFFSRFYIPKKGNYVINGSFQYDDVYGYKHTNSQSIDIKIGETIINSENQSSIGLFEIGLIIVIFLTILFIMVYNKKYTTSLKQKKKTKQELLNYTPKTHSKLNKDNKKSLDKKPIFNVKTKKAKKTFTTLNKKNIDNIENLIDNLLDKKTPANKISNYKHAKNSSQIKTKNINKPETQEFEEIDTLNTIENKTKENDLLEDNKTILYKNKKQTKSLTSSKEEKNTTDNIRDLIDDLFNNKKPPQNTMKINSEEIINQTSSEKSITSDNSKIFSINKNQKEKTVKTSKRKIKIPKIRRSKKPKKKLKIKTSKYKINFEKTKN